MRRKPLNSNPNSMHMIMENFKRFQNVLSEQFDEHDDKIYLFESNIAVPATISINEFVQRIKSKKLTENQAIQQWTESWDYEAAEVNRLYEQHMLLEQDEEVEEPQAKAPMWLRALGKMVNKGFDMLAAAVRNSLMFVVKITSKILGFVSRFKEKNPILYKIVFYGLLIALAVGIIYMIYKWSQNALAKSDAQGGQALCTQAIAGDVTLQEAIGKCIVSGQVLNQKTYEEAQGVLKMLKDGGLSPEDTARIEAAQESLTKCWEAAQDGETVNLKTLMESVGDADSIASRIVSDMRGIQDEIDVAGERLGADLASPDFKGNVPPGIRDKIKDLSAYRELGKEATGNLQDLARRGGLGDLSGAGEALMDPSSVADALEKVFNINGGMQPEIEVMSDRDILGGVEALIDRKQGVHGPLSAIKYLQNLNRALKEAGRDDLAAEVVAAIEDAA